MTAPPPSHPFPHPTPTNDGVGPRVFLDATVVFSAVLGGAGSSKLWAIPELQLITNTYALAEVQVNIQNRRDARLLERLDELLRVVEVVAYEEASLSLFVAETWSLPDPHDAPILIGAIESRADFLVTLDSDCFGGLFGSQVGGVTILKPGKLLAQLGL